MSERDPLLALRGLIDKPIAPRTAFADELRARLLTELGSHRPPAIDEERTMEITTPGLQLVLPGDKPRQLPGWRRLAEIAALIVLVFGVIAVFASERANSPSNPPPTSQGNLGVYPPSFATPDPGTVTENEANVGVLWKIPTDMSKTPLIEAKVYGGVTYFLAQDGYLYAVDSARGELIWKANVGSNWGVAVDDSGAYVTARLPGPETSSRLIKLDLTTGQELWRVSLGADISSQPMLSDSVAYVWDGQNVLYAIDTATGRELWQRHSANTPEGDVDLSSVFDFHGSYRPDALLEGDNLFVVTSDGQLGRIGLSDAKSGEWAWKAQLDNSGSRQYFLAATTDTVAAVSVPLGGTERQAGRLTPTAENAIGSLVVFDHASGEELWRSSPDDSIALIAATGDRYIVSIVPGSIPSTPIASGIESVYYESRSYDARTGTVQWATPSFMPWAITPDGSTAVSFSGDGFITLVETATGEVLGSTYPFGTVYGGFTVTNDTLYGIRSDGVLIAINLDTMKNGRLSGGATPPETAETSESPESDSALLWQTKPEGSVRWVGPEVLSNGAIYRLITTSDFQGVEAFDTTNGALLWRHPVQGTELVADQNGVYVTLGRYANPEMTISATPESFVIGPNDASVVALDLQTGDELWSLNTGTGESSPVLRDGTLYLLESTDIWNVARGTTQEATAIDSSTGSVLWNETVGAPMGQNLGGGYGRMVAANSNLVALLANGLMVGIDRANGAVLWEHVRFDPLNLGLSIDASGDTVVVSVHAATTSLNYWLPEFPELQSGSAVIAYNASDGTPLWAFDTGGVASNIVVANGKVIVKVFPTVLREEPDPRATPVGQFSETSFEIVGIDIATGEIAWKSIGGDGDRGNIYLVPSADDGSVILVDNRATSYFVIESATGSVSQSPLSFGQPIQGAPVADSERVYIQLKDGTITAAALSVPVPQLSQDEVADLLPDTGNPLPASVVWHVDQAVPWPPEAFGLPLGGMVVSDGIVYRAVAGFSFESEETAIAGIEAYDASSGELLWQTPLHFMSIGNTSGDSITAGDGAVYVVVNISADVNGPPTRKALIALDGKSGDERWRIEFEDDSLVTGPDYEPTQDPGIERMTYSDGVLYVANSSAVVTAFDTQTGDELWKSDAPPNRTMMSQATVVTEGSITEIQGDATEGSQVSITVSGDRIFVVTQSGGVVALDASTGDRSGQAIPSSTENTTAPVLIGNLLIVGNTVWDYTDDGFQVGKSGTLTAFDISNDYAIAWQVDVGRSADDVIVIDDGLYVTVGVPDDPSQTTVQRFNPVDGRLIWTSEDLGQYLILRNGTGSIASIVAQSIYDGVLYTLEPVTGDVISTNENIPAIALEPGDNGYYYATLLDGTLVGISPKWFAADQSQVDVTVVATKPPTPEATASPDAIAWQIDGIGSEIYAGDLVVTGTTLIRATYTDAGGRIDAFDTQTGEPIWNKSLRWMGGLVLGDGFVYVPMLAENTVTGSIAALVPSTGEIVWEQLLDGRPIIPALVGDKLFVAADSGLMTALDAQSGEILWANHAYTEPLQGYAGPSIPFTVGVSPQYVTALYPTGYFAVFDASTGKDLYHLSEYHANTQYTVINNLLIVLASLPADAASPSADISPPKVLRGIDLSNGDIVWENKVETRMNGPMIVVASSDGVHIQLLAEWIETEKGIYDENGFRPGGTISDESEPEYDFGVAFQIDPGAGEPTYVSINTTYPYQYTGPLKRPGSITIDFSQPPVSIDQPLATLPAGDQDNLYLLLADGSVVAVKRTELMPG